MALHLVAAATNADRDIKSALITVLSEVVAVSGMCIGLIKLGDGTKNLSATGGAFQLKITVGGQTVQPSPQTVTFSTAVRSMVWTVPFPVVTGDTVVLQVLSPNAADSDVDVTAYLYDMTYAQPDAVAGAANGIFIAGTNAAVTVTGAVTVGDGIAITCSTDSKSAIKATGGATAGKGVEIIGTGTGTGLATTSVINGGITTLTGATTFTGAVALSSTLTVSGLASLTKGVDIDNSTVNGSGVEITGNGTGAAVLITGGGTSGTGLAIVGGASNGIAVYAQGDGSGEAVRLDGGDGDGSGLEINGGATDSNGITITGNGIGHGISVTGGDGATGNGVHVVAVSTNGTGMHLEGNGAYSGLLAKGDGVGAGIYALGGATGSGIQAKSGAGATGHGISAESIATDGDGIRAVGVGAGAGINADAGLTGNGIEATGGGTSGDGLYAKAAATGHGIAAHGGGVAGDGINATADNDGDGIQGVAAGAGHFDLASDEIAAIQAAAVAVDTLTKAAGDGDLAAMKVILGGAIAEMGVGIPPATPTPIQALMYLYMRLRNLVETTATLTTITNNAGATIAKATLSDSGVTFAKDEYISG